MKKILSVGLLSIICSQAVFADNLTARKGQRFIKDFYQAVQQRDEKKLNTMLADDAKIHIYLLKMEQGFTLSKSDYLQQVKAAWYFGRHEKYQLKDIKYTLTQAGLSASLSLKVNESRVIFEENLSQEHEMVVDLVLIDEQIKIAALKTKTTF